MKVLHVTRTLPQEMLGPMYLSRAVKDAGHEMRAICLPDPRWLSKIREYRPDVITWSLMTGNHRQIFDVNRFLVERRGGLERHACVRIVEDAQVDRGFRAELGQNRAALCGRIQHHAQVERRHHHAHRIAGRLPVERRRTPALACRIRAALTVSAIVAPRGIGP